MQPGGCYNACVDENPYQSPESPSDPPPQRWWPPDFFSLLLGGFALWEVFWIVTSFWPKF
jgi:hypothetical protein